MQAIRRLKVLRSCSLSSTMQTIENTREKDVTMIAPDDTEVDADDAQDEFAGDVLLSS